MPLPVTSWGTAGSDITSVGFTKKGGTPADTGAITAITGGGGAIPSNVSSSVQYTWSEDAPSSADYWVEMTLKLKSLNKTQRLGVTLRSSTDSRTFCLIRAYYIAFASDINLQIYTAVDGSFAQVSTSYPVTAADELEFTLRGECEGSAIRLYEGGVLRRSGTQTAVTQVGRAGIYNTADVVGSDTEGFHILSFTTSFASSGTTFNQAISASVGVTGSVAKTTVFARAISAAIGVVASISKALALSQTVSASVSVTSSVSASAVIGKAISGVVAVTASMARSLLPGGGVYNAVKRQYGRVRKFVVSAIMSPLDRGD